MKLVRRAIGLFNWFKHKKRAVESIAQFAGSNSGAAQVGNHGCFAGYASVNTGLCSGRDVAAIASAILLICATGIGFAAAIYLLLFVSL